MININEPLTRHDMNSSNTEYWEESCRRLEAEIKSERMTIEDNIPTLQEAVDALAHHQQQLVRLGATLEDSVCAILRKTIEQAKAAQRLTEKEKELWECKCKLGTI